MFENRLLPDGRSAADLGIPTILGPVEKLDCGAQPGFQAGPLLGWTGFDCADDPSSARQTGPVWRMVPLCRKPGNRSVLIRPTGQ